MGTKLNTYAIGDVDLTNIMTVLDQTRIGGVMQVSLTNLSNTTVPAIAAGSFLEVAGALYLVSTEEAISTTDPVTGSAVVDGSIYVMAIPSGSSISFSFTDTAPTWSDAKQGWYGTGTYAGCRYVGRVKKSSSSYINKRTLDNYAVLAPTCKQERVTMEASFNNLSIVSTSTVKFSSVASEAMDTHGAFSASGTFTAPVSGVYLVSATTNIAGLSGYYIWIYKNSSAHKVLIAMSTVVALSGALNVQLNKGDTLEFYANGAGVISLTDVMITLVQGY